jgi:hypothetical protein
MPFSAHEEFPIEQGGKKMKRRLRRWVVLFLAIMFVAIFAPGTSRAEWYWTHGHSGHPGQAVSIMAEGFKVTGFDESVWVHYAVPTVGEANRKVRYIKVRYTLFNAAGVANIGSIHIYNGETKVKEFNSGWPPVVYPPVGTPYEPIFDLGTATAFDRGLGVSVRVDFDMNSGADSVLIHGVGANFEGSASVVVVPMN